ncbi:MAG: molybdenum cofactor biosynthesis protein [Chloroflexi bacterium]|nr:molybdenum cofactor biosynthesis protein [Chloroflexota bacterium]
MKPFGALLSFEEAIRVVEAHIKPINRTETIGIDEAVGRVLAEDIAAALSVPSFDRAAMDGYAVKAKDTFGAGQMKPKTLELAGELHAGDAPKKRVIAGQCIQISTGAMMPPGADAVLMVEDTEVENGQVKVFKAVLPGGNVGKMGEDIREGEGVLAKGTLLNAGKVGVLASQGIQQVKVYAQPKVAIMPSGEEVVELGKKLKPSQLYDINSHTVAAIVRENGGVPVRLGVVGDTREDIKAKVSQSLKNDLVVISGGSSVGERDLLVGVLEGWGEVLFHGIQVRPGKPTLFALIEGKPLFGMPGYPTSCLINSYLFVLPTIRKMAHLPPRKGETVQARTGRRIPGSVGRKQFLTVTIQNGEVFSAFKESGAITSIANADGYIAIEQNVDMLEKGTPVTVTLF